ncbi:MAG: HDIG domain-containing protein [Bacteroidetes bacterium]|nr:HDIG domain-containing protein [Bacteroidota bacterium]MBL7103134.1 HDIG domain-containing protein [Bacteroidales bacterium]
MKKILTYLRNHYADISKGSLFILSVVLLVLIFPKEGKFKYEFRKGKPWMHEDLIAPFDFAILKPEQELEEEKQFALKDLKLYFKKDEELYQKQKEKLINDFETKWQIKYSDKRRLEQRKEKNRNVCLAIFDTIMQHGIIELTPEIEDKPEDYTIVVITNNVAEEKQLGDLFTIHTADKFIHSEPDKFEPVDKNLVVGLLENSLIQNIKFDTKTTEREKQALLDKISLTRGMVQSGERIVSKGELVSGEKYIVLESLRLDYESKLGSSFKYAGILAGQIILLSVSMLSLFLFLFFFKKEIYAETKKIVLILICILFMVLITSLVVKYKPDYLYLIPICLIPIITGIFFDTRLALFVHLITIIITGLLVPNSYEYVFLQLFAGTVTILSIVRLERRSQFFLTSVMIFFTYSLIYTGMTLIKEGGLEGINYVYFVLFAGSATFTLFSYPIIFIFEKLFGLITDVTLLELSNTNNKVLRELALKAPGTFQHSMQVANLAEEAIYEIGGNPLLVRTGALFHDIGKIDDPLFFIENQTTGVNPHDELTYDESARIIIGHVIKGVEKAKKHKLPEQIIDFIRTHQGTRKTDYFYTLAKKDNPDEEIDESVYTYHGPDPFSKETAVLMMADTVEAASRSLKNPDEEAINNLVENVINKQMENRQFDNADITFRDIKNIKKIFKKKLMNIYHLRIEYPE